MYICFAEYKIDPQYMELYKQFTLKLQEEHKEVTIYEGTDQPLLFVELWNCATLEQAEKIKEERLDNRSSWSPITQWIVGGQSKLHVWTFQAI